MDQASLMLNDLQISELCGVLPGLYKLAQWKLLYRMSEHGVSMNTFYTKLSSEPASLVIMEDEQGYKFGAMAHEPWERGSSFYGTSESFVFTFKNGLEISYWEATGQSDLF